MSVGASAVVELATLESTQRSFDIADIGADDDRDEEEDPGYSRPILDISWTKSSHPRVNREVFKCASSSCTDHHH